MQSVFLPATECGSSDDVFIGADNEEKEVEDEVATPRTLRPRKLAPTVTKRDLTKQIREVVARRHHSLDEKQFLDEHCSLVKAVRARASSYSKLKQRSQEVFDDPVTLHAKCIDLAKALQTAKHAVVYTGAGISTAANIPDYRGTNGVWTRLKSGKDVNSCQNLVSAVPTFTHMCIEALVRHHIVQHVVSQNCDGLHVRSGVPSDKLSELHGNMFCEICPNCDATYYRLFDVTEHTALRRHSTGRTCDKCNEGLKDTIVHFGERSDARWPHNWESAESNADDADLILCLGSSLKVLRSYKQLWLTERTKRNRPKLYIVNLQWTPKDSQATSKINGSVDEVMKIVMLYLSIVPAVYFQHTDSLWGLARQPKLNELSTFTTTSITYPISTAHQSSRSEQSNIINTHVCSANRAASWPGPALIPQPIESPNFLSDTNRENVLDEKPYLVPAVTHSQYPSASSQVTGQSVVSVADMSSKVEQQTLSQQCVVSPAPSWFGKGYRSKVNKKNGFKKRGKRKLS